MHMQAWLHNMAGATKEQGKKQVPVYKNYKQFFDYEKQLKEVEQPKKIEIAPKFKKMAHIAKEVNKSF